MRHLIVIPAYNEEQALGPTIAELQSLPDGFDILVVNDGSKDRTSAVARALQSTSRVPLHVVDLPINCGIGVTVQTGYLFAQRRGGYQYVIQFDADGQHEPAALVRMVEECQAKNLDMCVGSRFLEPGVAGFQSTPARRLGIRFLAGLIRLLSGVRLTDPTSGMRCAGPHAWTRFARHYPEDYPEPESLFWCVRNRLRVGEIAVQMRPRKGGITSIRSTRIAYYMIKVSLAIVLDRLRIKEHLA